MFSYSFYFDSKNNLKLFDQYVSQSAACFWEK